MDDTGTIQRTNLEKNFTAEFSVSLLPCGACQENASYKKTAKTCVGPVLSFFRKHETNASFFEETIKLSLPQRISQSFFVA